MSCKSFIYGIRITIINPIDERYPSYLPRGGRSESGQRQQRMRLRRRPQSRQSQVSDIQQFHVESSHINDFQVERFNDFRLNSDFGGNFNSPDQFGANRPEYFDGDFASGGGGGGGYGGRPQSNYKRPSAPKRPPGLGSRVGLLTTPYPGLGLMATLLRGLSYLVSDLGRVGV